MSAPLISGPATTAALLAGLAIGIAFGWCLERAGMGNARKLAGQFYLTDFTVIKVMFSAILTAMIGAYVLTRVGMLDPERIYVPETFLVPQAIGGVLFGVGFVAAGLCPGTSCVAGASGRIDGLAVIAGLLAGVLLFAESGAWMETLYGATPRGVFTLPELVGAPTGLVVGAIALLAAGMFALAERLERAR